MLKFINRVFSALIRFCLRFDFFRSFTLETLEHFSYLLEEKHIIIDKGSEGYIQNNMFYLLTESITVVDKTKYLIIEKGKFKFELIDKSPAKFNENPGMMIADNSCQSYNNYWEDTKMLEHYLDEDRLDFFKVVYDLSSRHMNGSIIDIGCGSGDFLKIVYDNDPDCYVHGADFSSSSIKRCKRIMPKGNFLLKDIYHLDIEGNTFNTVICMEVLEHLDKPGLAFKEIKRICKSNGTIVITIPNGYIDDYVGHINFWGKEEFKEFIGNNGLLDFHYLEDERSMLFIIKNND